MFENPGVLDKVVRDTPSHYQAVLGVEEECARDGRDSQRTRTGRALVRPSTAPQRSLSERLSVSSYRQSSVQLGAYGGHGRSGLVLRDRKTGRTDGWR